MEENNEIQNPNPVIFKETKKLNTFRLNNERDINVIDEIDEEEGK